MGNVNGRRYNNVNNFLSLSARPDSSDWELMNQFTLSPSETQYLDALFSFITGGERRMDYKRFKRVYRDLNPFVPDHLFDRMAEQAFWAADSNGDGSLSFDEFVDSYANFSATPDIPRPPDSALFSSYSYQAAPFYTDF